MSSSGSYDKRRAAFRSSKSNFSKAKRTMGINRARSVGEIKRIAISAGELKKRFTELVADAVDAPIFTLINSIAVGDTSVNREGNRISSCSIELKMCFSSIVATTVNTTGFWAVVQDRQANGEPPVVSEIWDGADPAFGLRKSETQPRFKILAQDNFVITPYTGSNSMQNFHRYIDLSKGSETDRKVRYTGTSSGYATVGTNGIWLLIIPSNQANFSAGNNYAQVTGNICYSFRDL